MARSLGFARARRLQRGLGTGGGSAPTWTPAQLTQRLWLRADDLVLVGSDVDTWTDKTGTGNSLTPAAAANRPEYEAAGLGGRPSVRFNGSNEWLRNTAFSWGGTTNPFTVWLVLQSITIVNGDEVFGYGTGNRPTVLQATTTYTLRAAGGGSAVSAPTGTQTNPALLIATWDGVNQALSYVTSSADTTDTDANANSAAADGGTFALGATPVGLSAADMRVAEMGAMRSVISAPDRAQLVAYAIARYGL